MTFLLGLALGFLGCVAFLAYLIATAPAGYQDATGFHVGQHPDDARCRNADRLAAPRSDAPVHTTPNSRGVVG